MEIGPDDTFVYPDGATPCGFTVTQSGNGRAIQVHGLPADREVYVHFMSDGNGDLTHVWCTPRFNGFTNLHQHAAAAVKNRPL